MPDLKISELTDLPTPADDDLLVTVDVSDTSMSASGTDKKMQVQNLLRLSGGGGPTRSGSWVMAFPWANSTTLAGLLNRLLCTRCIAPFPVGQIAFETTAAAVGGYADIAIYNSDVDGWPTNLAASVQRITTDVAGFKVVALTPALPAGMYWMGLLLLNGAPNWRSSSVATWLLPSTVTANPPGVNAVGWQVTGQASVPDPYPIASGAVAGSQPVIWIAKA
jgi:hypothetical protein